MKTSQIQIYALIIVFPICILIFIATFTSSRTEEVVASPIPGLTPPYNVGFEAFQARILDNEGCDLPCWWDMYPGETTADEWLAFLSEESYDNNLEIDPNVTDIRREGSGNIYFGYDTLSFSLYFTIENSMLRSLDIRFGEPNRWLLPEYDHITFPQIIQQMEGIPDIYVFDDGPYTYDFRLLVVYPERGVMVSYSFTLEADDIQPREWEFCLGIAQTSSITLWLQNPDDPRPITQDIFSPSEGNFDLPEYVPIESLFSTSAQAVTEFFAEHPNECLEVEFIAP